MRSIVSGVAATFEMSATLRYERRYPALVNAEAETQHAIAAAAAIVGAENVDTDAMPEMGSEEFACMLQVKHGCYVCVCAGRGGDKPRVLSHHVDCVVHAIHTRK